MLSEACYIIKVSCMIILKNMYDNEVEKKFTKGNFKYSMSRYD